MILQNFNKKEKIEKSIYQFLLIHLIIILRKIISINIQGKKLIELMRKDS